MFATDRSYKSLELVRTTKFQSSADELPVASQNVDMVFSSEMLEHLPEKIFNGAIGEIKRATKKYVLLTFPNDENTVKNLVQCPNCQFIFNKSYHLRNLNLSKITSLFSEYTLQKHFVLGAKIRNYNSVLSFIKHKFSPSSSWIPKNWTPDGRRSTMCPDCETAFEIPYNFHFISFVCDLLNSVLSPKRPYQLCVLLKKNNA